MANGDARFAIDMAGLRAVRATVAAPLAEAIAVIAVNEIKLGMEAAPPRTGRTYPVPDTQAHYTASAPGEPPAIREGHYRDSWKSTPGVVRDDGGHAVAYSDETTEGGKHLIGALLEDGTVGEDGTLRIEPRPHIRPVLPEIQRKANLLARQVSR